MDLLRKISLIAFALLAQQGAAQSNLSVRYFGLTIHPFGDRQAKLQPYRLDENAYLVGNIGGFLSYEKFIWEDILSVKFLQGVYTDCSAGKATVTHVALQGFLYEKGKSRFSFGFGPVFMAREDWNRLPGYDDSGFFNRKTIKGIGPVQYKTFFYGFEFVYDRRIGKNIDLTFGFTPGIPLVCAISGGVKFWMNREFKKKLEFVKPVKKNRS